MSVVHAAQARVTTNFPGSYGTPVDATLTLVVNDKLLRRQDGYQTHDGMERPFALVPRYDASSHETVWDKHYLEYWRTDHGGTDSYQLTVTNVDYRELLRLGVAFGMDINEGALDTAWLQYPGDNVFPG